MLYFQAEFFTRLSAWRIQDEYENVVMKTWGCVRHMFSYSFPLFTLQGCATVNQKIKQEIYI
jgi:hypothetical protein